MPEFICITKCHWKKVWKPGDVYEGSECPNSHFKPMNDSSIPAAILEPANMSEINVMNMRPGECKTYIKRRYDADLDTTKPDFGQDALRIMRSTRIVQGAFVPEPDKKPEIVEVLTKKQCKEKIEEANPGIVIPAAALRSMKALKEFEAGLKKPAKKEDFLS